MPDAQIPVPPEWLPQLQTGDVLSLTAGERKSALVMRRPGEGGILAEGRVGAEDHLLALLLLFGDEP